MDQNNKNMMIYYGYEKLIPERYFCNKNELLYKYRKLHRIIGRNGYFRIVKKILIGMNKKHIHQLSKGAALGGHLEILKWIHYKGYSCFLPWNICTHAASNGHIKILKWAHKNCFK